MFLALAELKRAKTRFALLSFAVGLLVYLILFQQSLTNGLVTQFVGSIRNQSGPVLVLGADARKNLAASRLSPEQIDAVKKVPGVAESGRLGQGTFTVSSSKFATAADPTKEFVDATIFGYDLGGLGQPTTLVEGRLPTGDGEAVGSTLNKDGGFALGDVITVQPGGSPITIVGLADEINYSVTPTFFTSWNTYAAARKTLNPDATEVSVTTLLVSPASGTTNEVLAQQIATAVPTVDPLTRWQAEEQSPGVSSVKGSFSIIIALLWFVVLLTTGLFFLILTVQKTGSLTVLRAVGATGKTLVVSLLWQVLLVLFFGSLIAIAGFVASTLFIGKNLGLKAEPAVIAGSVGLLAFLALIGTGLGALRRIVSIDPVAAVTPQGGLR